MKHRFRIVRYSHHDMSPGDPTHKEVDIEIGEKYLCISTYSGYPDERRGYDSVFTKGNYYTLVNFDNDTATFVKNGGGNYFIRSFMEGALFNYFDFSKSLSGTRNDKIKNILDDGSCN